MRVSFRLSLLCACLTLGMTACGPKGEEGAAAALEASSQASRQGGASQEAHPSQEEAPADAEAPAVAEDGHTPTCTSPKKVLICHVPPGNPANAHTLCVGRPAESAHLAHGDTVGACGDAGEGEEPGDDTGNPGDGQGGTDAGSGEEPGPTCKPVHESCTADAECCAGLSCIENACSVVID